MSPHQDIHISLSAVCIDGGRIESSQDVMTESCNTRARAFTTKQSTSSCWEKSEFKDGCIHGNMCQRPLKLIAWSRSCMPKAWCPARLCLSTHTFIRRRVTWTLSTLQLQMVAASIKGSAVFRCSPVMVPATTIPRSSLVPMARCVLVLVCIIKRVLCRSASPLPLVMIMHTQQPRVSHGLCGGEVTQCVGDWSSLWQLWHLTPVQWQSILFWIHVYMATTNVPTTHQHFAGYRS